MGGKQNWGRSDVRHHIDAMIRVRPRKMSIEDRKRAKAQPAGKLVWSDELNRVILVPEKPE